MSKQNESKARRLRPRGLRCEYLENPLAVGPRRPRLGWCYGAAEDRGLEQRAWRILAASSRAGLGRGQGDLWDSGRVESAAQEQILYDGTLPAPGQDVFWKVMVWGADGEASAWSATARWTAGLAPGDWQAEWIGYDKPLEAFEDMPREQPEREGPRTPLVLPPARYLRREISLQDKPARARLYVTALGIHEFRINGERVGGDYFQPGWTDYEQRIHYQAYDVAALLEPGANALGAILADGWYAGYVGFNRINRVGKEREFYGKSPRLCARLEVEYGDGRVEAFVTDGRWRVAEGPIREADLQMGECYDARKEKPGWDRPGYRGRGWAEPDRSPAPGAALEPYPSLPTRRFAEHRVRKMSEPVRGIHVFDLGTNFAGFVRLLVRGAKRGGEIVLRFGERLDESGRVYTENLRQARAIDRYICKGEAEECWEPGFTFHGFQYVEVEGLPGRPGRDTITGVELTADLPVTGRFSCSDRRANRLYKNICQTQRSNFIEVPTDCPQRDERLGWSGDAQIYIATAAYNNHVAPFFAKWVQDYNDAQHPDGAYTDVAPRTPFPDERGKGAWADAGVICPWRLYEVYGDVDILRRHYPNMKRYLRWSAGQCEKGKPHIRKPGGYGDWLSIQAHTPTELLNTAYYAHCADLMGRIAALLGKERDAERYRALFGKIREAFSREFFIPQNGTLRGDTQTDYVLALAFDLVDGEVRERCARRLVDNLWERGWRLSTGFVGTKDLMNVLAGIGRNDIAYRLFHSPEFPGWNFSIRHGATSIWERWDGWTPEKGFQTPGMNSFAHYSFGAVGEWMFRSIGGIERLEPGGGVLRIRPRPGGELDWARVEYDAPRGPVAVRWERKGRGLTLEVELPPNVRAEIHVPAARKGDVKESGRAPSAARGLRYRRMEDGAAVFEAGSGRYRFRVRDAGLEG